MGKDRWSLGWARFLQSLKLDQRLEFEEGDVGIAGAATIGSKVLFVEIH